MNIPRTSFVRIGRTALVGVLAFWTVFGQVELGRKALESSPTIFFDAVAFASDQKNKSRLDMYVQMPYEEIRFVKEGEQFVGRYEISLNIFTAKQEPAWQQTVTVEVRVKDFAQSVSNRLFSLKQVSTDLEPGNYDVYVLVKDAESKQTTKLRRSVLITDFNKEPLSLSDIMLVNRLTTDGDKRSIVPNISGNVGTLSDGFLLFFEVYTVARLDSVNIGYKILNSKKEELLHKIQTEPITGAKTQSFIKIENLNLAIGTYLVTVEASLASFKDTLQKDLLATTSRTFSVRWADMPFSITDLDKAVEQMRYIAKESEMDYIRGAKDSDEKRARFLQFWGKRDPDPATKRNELMEEYYQRIEYANKNFTHYNEGWKTDMGMVYVIFGQPENVERHPFETSTRPYEVWYYYQQNRQFVFVDDSGFGNYRLRYPTTDLWGRVR